MVIFLWVLSGFLGTKLILNTLYKDMKIQELSTKQILEAIILTLSGLITLILGILIYLKIIKL